VYIICAFGLLREALCGKYEVAAVLLKSLSSSNGT
jgi:hypothetical protein